MYTFIELPRLNRAVNCAICGCSNFGSRTPPAVGLVCVECDEPMPMLMLGIEVTVPEQADLCVLGNIDGQHGVAGTPAPWVGHAACLLATEFPLPPGGATLATSRADLDSVAAMSVLVLRQLGLVPPPALDWAARDDARQQNASLVGEAVLEEYDGRLRAVAARDTFRPAAEWAPKPLPTPERPWGEATAVDSDEQLAHVASICSPRPGEPVVPMAERVATVACWLLWGDAASDYDTRTAIERATGGFCGESATRLHYARRRVEASRRALAEEASHLDPPRLVAVWWSERGSPSTAPAVGVYSDRRPDACIVRLARAGALGLGYCVAPLVIAFDQAISGKVTICGWAGHNGQTRYLDVPRLRERLNEREREAGGSGSWGGPPAMCCSPQVPGGTMLSEETIVHEASLATGVA